jgi:hypothetical protein
MRGTYTLEVWLYWAIFSATSGLRDGLARDESPLLEVLLLLPDGLSSEPCGLEPPSLVAPNGLPYRAVVGVNVGESEAALGVSTCTLFR